MLWAQYSSNIYCARGSCMTCLVCNLVSSPFIWWNRKKIDAGPEFNWQWGGKPEPNLQHWLPVSYLAESVQVLYNKRIQSACWEPGWITVWMSSSKSKSGSISNLCTVMFWYWSSLARPFLVPSVPNKTTATSSLLSAKTWKDRKCNTDIRTQVDSYTSILDRQQAKLILK